MMDNSGIKLFIFMLFIVFVVDYLVYGRCNIGIVASLPLLNLGVIELLNLMNPGDIIHCDQIDHCTPSVGTVTKTSMVDVLSRIGGQVEVDDDCHLLCVHTTSEHLRGMQHMRSTRAKVLLNISTIDSVHVAMHRKDS